MTRVAATDPRLARDAALLRDQAVTWFRLRAAGHANEILVIEGDLAAAERIAALAPSIKPLGFRYVTVDLGSAQEDDA